MNLDLPEDWERQPHMNLDLPKDWERQQQRRKALADCPWLVTDYRSQPTTEGPLPDAKRDYRALEPSETEKAHDRKHHPERDDEHVSPAEAARRALRRARRQP